MFSFSNFLAFLNSAIFLVGYISNNKLFPEPLNSEEEQKYLTLMKNRKWRCEKYINRKKPKISCTYL